MIEAIKLVSAHIKKNTEHEGHYISKIELVESSMVPPPQGSSRHWRVYSRKHREERAKEVILYVGMDGRISETPPARKSTTAEDNGARAEEKPESENDFESKKSFIMPADERLADLWEQIDPRLRLKIEDHLMEKGISAGIGSQILLSGLYENHNGLKDGTRETVAVFAHEEGIIQKRILWICVVNVTRMDSQLIYQFGDEVRGGRKVVK